MPRILVAFLIAFVSPIAAPPVVTHAQEALALAIVPMPSKLTSGRGDFTLTASTPIVADPALRGRGRQLASMLAPATGFDLPVRTGPVSASPHIALRLQKPLENTLGGEGYRLAVTPRAITIVAAAPAGIFYGMQTLRQLLPTAIFREAPVTGVAWRVPAVTIEDVPRFRWRGAHLDVFAAFPAEGVREGVHRPPCAAQDEPLPLAPHRRSGVASRDQAYPKLTTIAAWRKETLIGHHRQNDQQFDGVRHGGFYTQDDVREVVAYAAERFVTVVPEIEMPGHSQAIIAAYPELGCTNEPVEPRTVWGISPDLLNAEPSTITFMQNVLSEVLTLFPSPWIHVGGDEAVKTQWKASPRVQARIAELGLKNEEELQSWFIRQMDAFLTSKGRRLIGWDEILEGGLAENATVMSWRNLDGAMAAARAGHDAVLTPTDTPISTTTRSRTRRANRCRLAASCQSKPLRMEPAPPGLDPALARHFLGVQGQLWTEHLPGPKAVEYNAFPRLIALAEVGWTPAPLGPFEAFRARLITHLERLRILDVNFRPLE